MKDEFYTSDLHFGHTNVIGFDHRPFTDRDEMDRVMIELWNGRVQPDDTVYILGDICYHSQYGAEWYLRQLKGHKILILGNHDVPILSNPKALHYLEGVERMMHVQDGDKPRITDKVQIMFEDIEEFGIHGGLRQSDDTAII